MDDSDGVADFEEIAREIAAGKPGA
jgi:hypothetical protein